MLNTGELVFLYYSDHIFGINNSTTVNDAIGDNNVARILMYVIIGLISLAFIVLFVSTLLIPKASKSDKEEVNKAPILLAKLYCLVVDGFFLAYAIIIAESLDAALPFYKLWQDGMNYAPWIISLITFFELVVDLVEVIADVIMICCCGNDTKQTSGEHDTEQTSVEPMKNW